MSVPPGPSPRGGSRALPGVLAGVLAAAALLAGPAGAPAQAVGVAPAVAAPGAAVRAPADADQRRASTRAAKVLERVNRARSHARTCGGVRYRAAPPLRHNHNLARAARRHARDMARHDYFDHTGRSGSTPTSRARAAGYRGQAGENIAAGYGSPATVMRAWLASPGHCANIMSRQYRHLGVGYAYGAGSQYRTYWVQDFGLR